MQSGRGRFRPAAIHPLRKREAMLMSAPHSSLIDVATARGIALEQVAPVTAARVVPLASALGHIAATDVFAPQAMPFFTNSAMDGFALRVSDLAEPPHRLRIVGTVAAGAAAPGLLPPAAAIRIYTGAPLPGGADAVVPVEEAEERDGCLVVRSSPAIGANIRAEGSDQPAGACLLARGTRIAPHHVGLLAANGIARVKTVRPPRVVVFSTGDELAGKVRGAGQIHDANRPMLMAMCAAAGAEVLDGGALPDDMGTLARRLADLVPNADLLLSSGGVSMGGRDPLRPAFAAMGGDAAAWQVAIKPGKPVFFGRIGPTAFTGLPGNPMAAFVGFHLFVRAQIAVLSGGEPPEFAPLRGRAAFAWQRRPGRQEVFPVRCAGLDETGLPRLERLGEGVSATLFPLTSADGLAVVSADTAKVDPGDLLGWQPFCTG